jgi:uridine kinase
MRIVTIADELSAIIKARSANTERFIVAIDGRCASGKTTLASALSERLSTTLLHMDDFYLPLSRRTENTFSTPAGHMDFERLLSEVIIPITEGRIAHYRPYLCKTASFGEERTVEPSGVIILEGSYSHHPVLKKHCDLSVFLRIDKELQSARIREREGEGAKRFFELWIPREEEYFRAFDIEAGSDLSFDVR